jgi:soluble lytic murein transglycosylase-like protein
VDDMPLTPIIAQAMQHASDVTGVPYALVNAVAYVESRYDSSSVGTSGEQGVMQLMPAVRKAYGVANGFDPVANTLAGARLLKAHYERFRDWWRVLAAYNWGAARVLAHPDPNTWPAGVQRYVAEVSAKAGLGPPPFGTTIPIEYTRVSSRAMETLRRWQQRGL